MNSEIGKWKKVYETHQEEFKVLTNKYENAMKEKMLMKLEKDRLLSKVENLETNLKQIEENAMIELKEKEEMAKRLKDKNKQA